MEKWVILKTLEYLWVTPKNRYWDLEELLVCEDDGVVLFFDSKDEAADYQEEHKIDGRPTSLPLY